jgi:hypothetical protein
MTKISYKRKIQLAGLMYMAEKHYKKFRELETHVIEALGDEQMDIIADQIYGNENFDIDDLLKKCKIEVDE